MSGLPPRFSDLGRRANLVHHEVSGKPPVIVYEDHRYLLNIIDHAMRFGVLKGPPTLFMFDYHDDAKQPNQPAMKTIRSFRRKRPTQRDLWSFVEWELSGLDDDWVIAGMELDLIADFVVIGAQVDENIRGITKGQEHGYYKDAMRRRHLVASVGHVWSGLGHQGWLVDLAQSAAFEPIWNALGWDPGGTLDTSANPVLVDFCLDCFTSQAGPNGEPRPWHRADFMDLFQRPVTGARLTAEWFVNELLAQSPFVGIARESGCCGGISFADQILRNLDVLFFGGELRPSTHGR